MANPICSCGKESTWIDNGPRLQYHYCRDCKVEVSGCLSNVPASANYTLGSDRRAGITPIVYVGPTVINVPPPTPQPIPSSMASYIVTLVDLARREVHLEATTINTTRVVPLNTVTYILNRSPGISDKITGYDFSLYPRYNPAPLTTPGQHQFDPNTGNCDACGISILVGSVTCPGAAPNPAASPPTVQPRCPAQGGSGYTCKIISHSQTQNRCMYCYNLFPMSPRPIP